MSGTPIRTTVEVSAAVMEAARAASAAGRQARIVAIERGAAAARARGITDARAARLRARLDVLLDQSRTIDADIGARLGAASRVGDLVALERDLDEAEVVVDAAVERDAVRRELLRRVAGHLPTSLRTDVEEMRTAPSGAVRIEALRHQGGRLGIEVAEISNDRAQVTFDVARAGLHPRSGSYAEQCAHEESAVGQVVDGLAAAGLAPSELIRDGHRVARAGKRTQAPERRSAGA